MPICSAGERAGLTLPGNKELSVSKIHMLPRDYFIQMHFKLKSELFLITLKGG
jgi:hypothetical protein